MAHAKAGAFLAVPNVQALAETWHGSGEPVPLRYIRTEEVSGAGEVVAGCAIPVVDLSRLLDPLSSQEELANLSSASQHWGFFQLVNHGVPDEVIQDVKRDMTEFFNLPLEAKKEHAQVAGGVEGYGQSFVFSETQKLDWADMIYLMISPKESRDLRFWPTRPPSFMDSIDRYSAETARVTACLLRSMAADLGLPPERLLEEFRGQPQSMRTTYYPPCRQAADVLGLSPHTDATGLALLLHVNDVQGLQIRRDGKWLAVDPLDGAFVVVIGDTLEILSNGRYRSIVHRAVVHPDKERISATMFHQPCPDTTIGPLPELVERDSGGARYRSVGYMDFMKSFFASKLDGRRSHMDALRIY